MGKPSTIEVWEELGILEDNLGIMHSLAYQGVKMEVIAHAVGITDRTLQRMRKEDPRVFQALRRGREALVADTGKMLMDWVKDEKVPISLRIQIADDLNKRHGREILALDNTSSDRPAIGGSSSEIPQRVFIIDRGNKDGGSGDKS